MSTFRICSRWLVKTIINYLNFPIPGSSVQIVAEFYQLTSFTSAQIHYFVSTSGTVRLCTIQVQGACCKDSGAGEDSDKGLHFPFLGDNFLCFRTFFSVQLTTYGYFYNLFGCPARFIFVFPPNSIYKRVFVKHAERLTL